MDAALVANSYNSIRNTTNVVVAFDNNYLEKTLNKIWDALNFLNDKTDGGFFKLRQVEDSGLLKRASHYKIIEGQKIEEGWMSQIQGINADKPRKIRGDRTDLLFYEEFGCHAPGTKVLMANGRLKNVEDIVIGDKVMGDDGTLRTVIELHHGIDQMYKIIPKNGIEQIVNSNHIIHLYDIILKEEFDIPTYYFFKNYTINLQHLRLIKYTDSSLKQKEYSTFTIEPYREGEFFGFSLDGNQLFLLEDFTICHNSWPNSLKAFEQGDALVGIQGSKFGVKVAGGR